MTYMPPPETHGEARTRRQSANTPTTPLSPSSSQMPDRPAVAGLDAGMAFKCQVTSGTKDKSQPKDPAYLGTLRSIRFKNLFAGAPTAPNLLEVTHKIYNLIKILIKLPNKGAEKISSGAISVAKIKSLAARLIKLAELQEDKSSLRRNTFLGKDEDQRVEQALAGANTFGCKVPDVIKAKLDKQAKELAENKQAASLLLAALEVKRLAKS